MNVNDMVVVFYGKMPRNFWRIAIVTRVLPGIDSKIREERKNSKNFEDKYNPQTSRK